MAADSDKLHMLSHISCCFNIVAVTRRDAVERAHIHVDWSPRLPARVFLANGPSINFLQVPPLFKDGDDSCPNQLSHELAVRPLFCPKWCDTIMCKTIVVLTNHLFVYLYFKVIRTYRKWISASASKTYAVGDVSRATKSYAVGHVFRTIFRFSPGLNLQDIKNYDV